MRDFSGVFAPGANHFELMRHIFSLMVLVDHAFVLGGFGHALGHFSLRYSLGHVGVACFFVLSGALVSASRDHCDSTGEFLRNRALRIYPAYAVCLLVSAFLIVPLGALAETGSLHAATGAWLAAPGPVEYVLKNALLFQVQLSIGDVFATHAEPGAVNGSLWSIPWEAGCYLLVMTLGLGGGLARRRWLVPVGLSMALANCWLFPAGSVFGVLYMTERIVLLPVYFLLGMAFYLFRARLPLHRGAGLLAAVGYAAVANADLAAGAPLLAYAILALGAKPGGTGHTRRAAATDLSYGLYIYAFPIQQALVALGVAKHGAVALLVSSLALAAASAWMSWRWIEAPALALKRRGLFVDAQQTLSP